MAVRPAYMRAMSHAARVPFPAIANKVGPKKSSASQVGVGRDAHVQNVHHNARTVKRTAAFSLRLRDGVQVPWPEQTHTSNQRFSCSPATHRDCRPCSASAPGLPGGRPCCVCCDRSDGGTWESTTQTQDQYCNRLHAREGGQEQCKCVNVVGTTHNPLRTVRPHLPPTTRN